MRLWAAFVLATLAALAPAVAGTAAAQAPYPGSRPNYGPGYRPGLSPYLNILGRGGDPAVNYYLGTRPEFQRRSDAARFNTEIRDLETRRPSSAADEEDVLGRPTVTGHVTAFNNTAGYFNSMSPRTPGGVAAPAARTPAPPPRRR